MNADQLRESAAALLAAHPLAGDDADSLARILADCRQRTVRPGGLLCREGQGGTELYFLLRGEVEVLKRDPEGFSRELSVIPAPALLGHMSLVDRSARSATCRAVSDVVVAALPYQDYLRLYTDPGEAGQALRRLLIASMVDQLDRGNRTLAGLISPASAPPPEEDKLNSQELLALSGEFEGWC
jgi:CRP/FNR family cyclic AMP-dependent transcriptional regulator